MNNNYYDNYIDDNKYDLFGAYEGYLKGNMFKNLYNQYKNYKPETIKPNTEKEQELFNLNQIGFALHDLNLYLDVNPNDKKMLDIFEKYKNLYNDIFTQYEGKYGPISVNNVNNITPFEWENSKFPWEVR